MPSVSAAAAAMQAVARIRQRSRESSFFIFNIALSYFVCSVNQVSQLITPQAG